MSSSSSSACLRGVNFEFPLGRKVSDSTRNGHLLPGKSLEIKVVFVATSFGQKIKSSEGQLRRVLPPTMREAVAPAKMSTQSNMTFVVITNSQIQTLPHDCVLGIFMSTSTAILAILTKRRENAGNEKLRMKNLLLLREENNTRETKT